MVKQALCGAGIDASNLSLASGPTLTGTGTVGGISAAAGAIVAPAGAKHTDRERHVYAQRRRNISRPADASGAASRLNVNGAATLEGGTVDVQAEDGNYAPATRYTILNASAGVGGVFGSVTSNLAFLTPTLAYDPTNVFLTLARNDIDFAAVALTPNQRQVSNALDQATAANATGDMATVIDAVTSLSAPQARSARPRAANPPRPSRRAARPSTPLTGRRVRRTRPPAQRVSCRTR